MFIEENSVLRWMLELQLGETKMTKCGAFWKKALQFKKNEDFDGFCDWCGSDRDHLREDWKITGLIETMQICMDDINKLPSDSFRPLIRKQNETLLPEVLPKIRSYIKSSKEPLTRKKVEEFINRARGVAKVPPRKFTRCGFPECMKGAYEPEIVEGVPLCPDCAKKIEADPSLIKKLREKPVVKEKTTKKTYKPTWEEIEARMHPKESKMELEVIQELQAEGWPIDTDYWIPLTKPDGYLHEIRLPLEVDGEQVHKGKKAERDDLVNEILRRRGIEPARERFSSYSVKRKEEIKASFRERMIQGYREKGLELPSKVQEKMEILAVVGKTQ